MCQLRLDTDRRARREDQMSHRCLAAVLTIGAVVWLAPAFAAGQATTASTAPRTPWGDPDLQGTYTNKTITPLERPEDLAERAFLTEEEVATLEQEAVDRNIRLAVRPAERTTASDNVDTRADGTPGFYNNFWLDGGTTVVGTRRTSLIIDPPDGRIPRLTPEAQKRESARERALVRRTTGQADSWDDLDLNDRCMLWSVGPPMLPTGYNNNFLILQSPGYVVIHVEMIHDTRIIPLDGRPRLGSRNRQWLGDMRGHWEGETLVVETINLATTEDGSASGNDPIRIRAASGDPASTLRVVERFRRVDADTISYQFTIEDQTRWTKPWTGEVPMMKTEGPLFEYACHEGNHSIVNVLSGARTREKGAAGASGTSAR